MSSDPEVERVRHAYGRRADEHLHHPLRPDKVCELAARAEAWSLALLQLDHRLGTVLDVGAGDGGTLRWLRELGAARTVGVDLLADRARQAMARGTVVLLADARSLPFPASTADSLVVSTLFSSVLDDAARQRVAQEIRRVVRPGGVVLFYDFCRSNPANPDVRPVTHAELRALFPGWSAWFRRTTLAPPLARRLVNRPAARAVLGLVPLLRTHVAGVLVHPG